MNPVGVLVDTNVASFLIKSSPESGRYKELIRGRPRWLSVVSVAELRYGAVKNNWGDARRLDLETFVGNAAVVSASEEIAGVVAVVMNRRERKGRRMDWNDAWIAATAIVHKLPLVTHDSDFFEIEDLAVITALSGLAIRDTAPVRPITHGATAEAAMVWLRRYLVSLEAGAEATA